ncbi:MAG: glycosyltransferase family 4 protein [Bacteriovoracaceae bacterium]|nr:glycosyltransferase family 4 protein [Bacteriovoracaceae bacterium]
MKICYDHQIFLIQKYGGISRYFAELAKNMVLQNNEVNILAPIYTNSYLHNLEVEKLKIHGLFCNEIPKGKRYLMRFNELYGSLYMKNHAYDVFHETYYSAQKIAPKNQAVCITVYDMIHEKFPAFFVDSANVTAIKKHAIERADKVIAISHQTKKDLVEIFNIDDKKIDVIHLGQSQSIVSLDKTKVDKDYVLYVGDRGTYKNFERVLEVFHTSSKLKNDFALIFFGGGKLSEREKQLIATYHLEDAVKQVVGDDRNLMSLYRNATCFVYPSLYEGFGLPPLEAMANLCACAVSNTSSIPEVCGDAAVYFDPYSVEDMKLAIESICYDSSLRNSLIERGTDQLKKFSWEKCAMETLATYERML